MNNNNRLVEKLIYSKPSIETIMLDNEISLVLQSYEPPEDPGSDTPPGDPSSMYSPGYFNNDPFRNNHA